MSRQASPEEYQGQTLMLVLSYFGIFCLAPYFMHKDRPYIRHHAANGLALLLGYIIVLIPLFICVCGGAVIDGMIGFPIVSGLGTLAMALVPLAYLILAVLGIVKAIKGEYWELPALEGIAAKLR